MPKEPGLRHGPLGANCVHLCVDMQRLFSEKTDWNTPWMVRVLPNIRRIVEAHPGETIFTRFIPLRRAGDGRGTWRRYYEHWSSMTLESLGERMVDLVPDLAAFAPPAEIVDKTVYSPWLDDALDCRLAARGTDTLIVTGGETDVCVLGTVLGGVDRGYRIVVVTDALCSSTDETHDASMGVYRNRYGQQVETVETEEVLAAWT
jgi:nicotinamidase-related amidase